jgi:uncharacterized protein
VTRDRIILDTGVLVAAINSRDRYHQWAKTELNKVKAPILTCEAVITEACFLLQNLYAGEDSIFGLLRDNLLTISFHLEDEIVSINELMNRYQSVPMSFADACLVRMSELYLDSIVLTLDSDFMIYRKNRNQVISLIIPSSN